MVSLEDRSSYIRSLENNVDMRHFIGLLFEEKMTSIRSGSFSDLGVVCDEIISSLKTNDNEKFINVFNVFSKRNPTSESPWIYNDLLMFLLVCCVSKFECDKNWLQKAIELRKINDPEQRKLKQTFILLLTSDQIKDQYALKEVEFVYVWLCNKTVPENNVLNSKYDEIANNTFPSSDSEFLNILVIKTIDLITKWKGLIKDSRSDELNQFVSKFLIKTERLGKVLSILSISIIVSLIVFIAYLFYNNLDNKVYAFAFALTGALGVSVFGTFNKYKKRKILLTRFIRRVLGYQTK